MPPGSNRLSFPNESPISDSLRNLLHSFSWPGGRILASRGGGVTLRSGELNAANREWAICQIVILNLAAMTLSYAPFRHDDVFLQEDFEGWPRGPFGGAGWYRVAC